MSAFALHEKAGKKHKAADSLDCEHIVGTAGPDGNLLSTARKDTLSTQIRSFEPGNATAKVILIYSVFLHSHKKATSTSSPSGAGRISYGRGRLREAVQPFPAITVFRSFSANVANTMQKPLQSLSAVLEREDSWQFSDTKLRGPDF